jgi:hypothetical protein
MRCLNPRLRTVLLLLVAATLASQAWHRGTGLVSPAATDPLAADLQLAICSLHGLMRWGADGPPAPEQETPACPWCALAPDPGLHLTTVVTAPIEVLRPPRTLYAALPALAPSPPPPLSAWAAPPPRAPPGPLRA